MARKGKSPGGGMAGFVKLIILPLLALDSYAFWKLREAAGSWSLSIVPGSIPEILTQLAAILALNIGVILVLVVYVYRRSM